MYQLVIVFLLILLVAVIVIIYMMQFFLKKISELEKSNNDNSGLQMLNMNMQHMSKSVADAIENTNRTMNERLNHASSVMMAVNQELGQMKEIGLNLKNIQDFLKSPKLRGNLGEQGLKELLSSALPAKYFDLQYSMRSGVIVDAIIHLDAGKIPIDSKFPLENFNQMLRAHTTEEKDSYRRVFRNDFRKHVNAISKKYINPDEGTVEFAFMYIPSESIYFEVINNEQDLFEYAANAHVVLSSPSTFFYYLRTIMLGLEGKRMTEMSREILKTLRTVKLQSNSLGESLATLNRHITNSSKTMSQVADQYEKLADRINKVDLLEEKEERLLEEDYEK